MTEPNAVEAAHAALLAAAGGVDGVRAYVDPGSNMDPPAVLIGPPRLEWDTYSTESPATAQFVAIVMVKFDDRAIQNLERIVPLVGAAIFEADTVDAVVGPALPGVWRAGTTELPCYEIQIEVSLL